MSRLSKILSLIVLLVFLLACNFVTQPLNDAQNLSQTAQAVASSLPIETLQAAASQIASAIPAETLQALPSAVPTLEALASALPDFGNMFNPQGTPVQDWRGIPILPEATAGQEFSENNTYSFKANVTAKDIQDFYNEKLAALGWSQPFSLPIESEGGLMVFRKDNNSLAITITPSEGSVVVLLVLTQA
ncbi:MAG TPA: hypothetical protein VFS61_10880 [Anaerolineales bacterium]|nr:hypothetical protein [Anaerolineales bacterium]